MSIPATAAEAFTEDERRILQPYFSNLDSHVFALTNLPETVKGALFARYSRSAKSLRRLFLDEFAGNLDGVQADASTVGVERAETLVRQGLQRLRRRLGRAARRRARGLRVRLQRPDQDPRVGTPHGVPRAVDTLRPLHRQAPRPLALSRAGRSGRLAPRPVRDDDGCGVRDVCVAHRRHAEALRRALSARAAGFRSGASRRHPRQGARHAAGHAPGGDAVERGYLRDRAGVRGAPTAHARASARGSQAVRRPDAGRAEEARPRVPDPRRSTRARRALEPVPRVRPRQNGERGGGAPRRGRGGAARGSHAHGFRSRRRDQDRRGRALRRHRFAGRPAAGVGAPHDAAGARVGARRVYRAARQPSSPARGARSSARRIVSTSSRTTARSAICSVTGC